MAAAKACARSTTGSQFGVYGNTPVGTNGLFSATIYGETHLVSKQPDSVYSHFSLDWHLSPCCALALCDRLVFVRRAQTARHHGHTWIRDNRTGFDVTLTARRYGWTFVTRPRVFYRQIEDSDDFMRYGSRNIVFAPWHWTSLGITPYGFFEWFLDDNPAARKNDKFDLYIFHHGLSFKVNENARLLVYYELQMGKSIVTHDWAPGHTFGVFYIWRF